MATAADGGEAPAGASQFDVARDRLDRLLATMLGRNVDWLLTADPINITYATGVRNMNVFSMMGPTRLLLLGADGTTVVWEFAGSEHLAETSPLVGEVRTAPGLTSISGAGYSEEIRSFATEVAALIGVGHGTSVRLAVERLDHDVTDSLRSAGIHLTSATSVFVESRRVKAPSELEVMGTAMKLVELAVLAMVDEVHAGTTEIEVWSHFHRHLIASGGEFVSTRLVQAGERTFPYFQEAGPNVISVGDLFCIDTDAIGIGGYAVDFSRTYHVGPSHPTARQRELHRMARDQLEHNASFLGPGVSFEDFARSAWKVPDSLVRFGYSSLAHGLGMSGEYPYIPSAQPGLAYGFAGQFDSNMVICVESYIGDPDSGQGVKLEDQFLITEGGAERMSTLAFAAGLNA